MQNSNILRLFISSTFNDFKEERTVLQTKVFPVIKDYASSNGFIFQPIDLRWGVSNEAQYDQKTLEVCLNEVRACKERLHPNFLIMAGDRYGWIPLPYAIEQTEFENILRHISDKQLVNTWYKLDLNQIPASYILQERVGEFQEHDKWVVIEDILRKNLQEAVESSDSSKPSKIMQFFHMPKHSSLSPEQRRKYFLSATEAEVEEGIIPYIAPTLFQQEKILSKDQNLAEIDSQNIFGFFRTIDISTKQGTKFFSDDYENAKKFKEDVKKHLSSQNILSVKTEQLDKESLNLSYLQEFEKRIIEFLKTQIDIQKSNLKKKSLSPLQEEKLFQESFLKSKLLNYIPHQEAENAINSYIKGSSQTPFVLYGSSGKGKSTLMAKAIQEIQINSTKKIIYRFIGATSHTNSSYDILLSIFNELNIDIQRMNQEESFEDFSKRAQTEFLSIEEDVVLFIDALDQINNQDNLSWLPQILQKNLKIILSVLEDENYKDDSKYFNILKTKKLIYYKIPDFTQNSAKILLHTILHKYNRNITKTQENYFLEYFNNVSSPLYVLLAAHEMKHWSSSNNNKILSNTQKGMVQKFINNLFEFHHQDKNFVQRLLGYVYASRDGLSEYEILSLLEEDKEFIKLIADERFHKNHTLELPLVHYSRFQEQFHTFFSLKNQDNQELLYFFHREFIDVQSEDPQQKYYYEKIIQATQQLIQKYQYQPFTQNRWGILYITLLSEYNLKYQENLQKYIEFLTDLSNHEWILNYISYTKEKGFYYLNKVESKKSLSYFQQNYHLLELLYKKNSAEWVEEYITTLNDIALAYSKNHQLEKAIELIEKGLKILEPLFKDNIPLWINNYLRSLNNLATFYDDNNQLIKALEIKERSLDISELLYKEDSKTEWVVNYITSLNNLATSYYQIDQLQKAILLEKKALDILEPLYEKDQNTWAKYYTKSLSNLGNFHKKDNELEKAILLEEKALNIRKIFYKKHPDTWAEDYTTSLSSLALSHYEINQVQNAILLEKKALDILKSLYEKNPDNWIEDYITSLNSLAKFYKKNNQFQEAILLYKKALNILEPLYYGSDSIKWAEDYALLLGNLANTYFHNNQNKDSIILSEKALNILKDLYEKDTNKWAQNYITALNNLAHFYAKNDQLDKAIILQEESLHIFKPIYEKDSDKLAEKYTNYLVSLSGFYLKTNQLQKTIILHERTLEMLELLYKKDPASWRKTYMIFLKNLSSKYQDNNQLHESILVEEKSLKIKELLYKQDSDTWTEDYTTSLNNLAYYYTENNQLQEAARITKKYLDITEILYKNNPNKWSEDYIIALTNLAVLFYKTDANKQAKSTASLALEISQEHYGTNHSRTQELLEFTKNIKTSISQDNTYNKEQATFIDLLYLAKFISNATEENEISESSFVNAFQFIEFNENARNIFSQLVNLEELSSYTDAKKYIEIAKNSPKLPYAENIKELIIQLQKLFENTSIGTLK